MDSSLPLTIASMVMSGAIVSSFIPKILMLSLRKRLIDAKDPRKIHRTTASRLGGVAFYPAIFISIVFFISLYRLLGDSLFVISTNLMLEFATLLIIYMMGIYDDLIGVPYRTKFAIQLLTAVVMVFAGTYIKFVYGVHSTSAIPLILSFPLSILFIVFVTNAINLIDGINGLASMLSILALMTYGILFFVAGDYINGAISLTGVGALVPFWYNNVFGVRLRTNSRIFMGDGGALVIGFMLSLMSIRLWNIEGSRAIFNIYHILAYTMLLIPCLDVVRIVLHRYRAGRALFMPDKNHIHHKFMALGSTSQEALLKIVKMQIAYVVLNLVLSLFLNILYIIAIDIVVWTLSHVHLSKQIKRRSLQTTRRMIIIVVALIVASCASQRDIAYFQDAEFNEAFDIAQGGDISIKKGDMLSIVVSSKTPELAVMFNLPRIEHSAANGGVISSENSLSGYTVNSRGDIDFPVLGELHVEGLSREGLSTLIKSRLSEEELLNDPVVTVNFLNLHFYVMGEVSKPGKYPIDSNQTTILEALSSAGDMTIYGKRGRVVLARDVEGQKIIYKVDMRSKDLYLSPAYYVQQNDVIYVEPNKIRANQSTVNGNTIRSTSFWMSLASLATTLVVLFAN